ncbi:MAG TPA: DMT family transporter [Gammaproteobacteria bacterium]
MNARQWSLLALLALLWGGAFFFVEVALQALPPLTIVAARLLLAALALQAITRLLRLAVPHAPRTWAAFLLLGLLNNALPFSLISWGQQAISGSLASILNATTPLFTVVLAHWLTADERLAAHKAAGVLLGLGGVIVLVGPGALAGLGESLAGQLAVLAAAASYACAGLFARRFRALHPLVTASGMVSCSALVMLPVALFAEHPWQLAPPPLTAVAAVTGLALLCTVLAYLIFFRLLAVAGATNALLVTFLIPVSAILLGALLLGERLSAGQLAGMGLIGLGLAAVDGRAWPWRRRHAPA